ncbi:hypothetical protein QF046_002434 [Microbacterium sp. W4I4]|uniref:hypothetical protein n=1 Tax=Microbacterium sp. W4I4 TaxID=3042295 RepID=UPI0027896FAC|nr:hypothetical protein [Microbacterium sp. W4I4]MDQ0614793.1 hypothetical protein [Microbacterium sp. W4I4]
MQYRPTGGWIAGNVLGGAVAGIVGIIGMLKTWGDGPLCIFVPAAVVTVLAVVMLIRMPWVGMRTDDRRLVVHGVLWSRSILRDQLDSVPTEPAFAWVGWHTRNGVRMRTPLTFMWPNRSGRLPSEQWEWNRDCLRALTAWMVG